MDLPENVGGRDRLARAVLTVVLTIAAIRSLRNGKRLRGLLAGIGALAFGFNTTTKYCGLNDELNIDTTGDEVAVDFGEMADDAADEIDDSAVDEADDPTGDGTNDDHFLTCAACGEPIVPGESRGPNENDETVHDRCQ